MSEFAKLKWQCRRGTLELDMLLQRYLETRYAAATAEEKRCFVDLLALEDDQLLAYLMDDRQPAIESFRLLLQKIRDPD